MKRFFAYVCLEFFKNRPTKLACVNPAIIELFNDRDLLQANEKNSSKEKAEQELKQAEEFRLKSLETPRQTSQRNGAESSQPTGGKRRKLDDGMDFLKEKYKHEAELRQAELDLRKQELDKRRLESQRMQALRLQQQQQTTELMKQSHEMNKLFMQHILKK